MKASFFLAALCLLSLSVFVGWVKYNHPYNGLNISISENGDHYRMEAVFNENLTADVQDYINDSIRPNGLFRSTHDYMNVSTTLADKTEFNVKESPGKLMIEIDKHKNTYESYLRIKKMCQGVIELLKKK
ncbi:MAG TPA: hypothetical protein VIM55_02765 [Mucilaginibacter sp.]